MYSHQERVAKVAMEYDQTVSKDSIIHILNIKKENFGFLASDFSSNVQRYMY